MNTIKSVVLASALASVLVLTGCSTRNLMDIPERTVSPVQNLASMEVAIEKAAKIRHWNCIEKQSNYYIFQFTKRKQVSATVKVSYTPNSYKIDYVDSTKLGYKNRPERSTIHWKYNDWVVRLDSAIRAQLPVGIQTNTTGNKKQ